MASPLNYVLAELESMLTTRVSETVNRFVLLKELCATNGTLLKKEFSKKNLNINNL